MTLEEILRRPSTLRHPPLHLPFDGRLSPDEQRMLDQFTFATDQELEAA